MAIKIDSKITGYEVVKKDVEPSKTAESNVVHMHEQIGRPEMLLGSTYKIKTPLTEHALYVTINDIVLNEGTAHEKRRPFEIFINSKSMDHFQWVVALTRVISAVFRKGGDVTFLVEELRSVFDPRGGYFKKGRYTPSIVAELGDVIECHLKMIGLIKSEEPDAHQQKYLAEKRAQPAIFIREGRKYAFGRPDVMTVDTQCAGTDDHCVGDGAQQAHHHAILGAEPADVPTTGVSLRIERDDAVQRGHEIAEDMWM